MQFSVEPDPSYNLAKFANLRGYITIDEFAKTVKKRMKIKEQIEQDEREREKRFVEKYGTDMAKWPEDVREKFFESYDMPE